MDTVATNPTNLELRDALVTRLHARLELNDLKDGVLSATVAYLKDHPEEREETLISPKLSPTLQKYARHASGPQLVRSTG